MSNPYHKNVYTGEAVLIGAGISLLVGFIVGLAAGLMVKSFSVGVFVGLILFVFTMVLIFRGLDE